MSDNGKEPEAVREESRHALPAVRPQRMAVIDGGGGVEFADPPPEPRRGDETKTETIENA